VVELGNFLGERHAPVVRLGSHGQVPGARIAVTPHADQVHPQRAVIRRQAGQAAFLPQQLDLAGQFTENYLQDLLKFPAVLGAADSQPGSDDGLVDALPEPEFDDEPRLARAAL
jgi:hypothetical protein